MGNNCETLCEANQHQNNQPGTTESNHKKYQPKMITTIL